MLAETILWFYEFVEKTALAKLTKKFRKINSELNSYSAVEKREINSLEKNS